ncbi:hypothetical protein IEQ34_021716 [Dendrobium chrysotoxum]|uniref:Uncharacterized protein n=1 Tax=Dendrobium chrysotoxum TaxID=161865 RepID=A0AAV7G5X0_DENCH|nr:hypothetical protein IEQ34_021716 [Dendrobium chrysotoxum]
MLDASFTLADKCQSILIIFKTRSHFKYCLSHLLPTRLSVFFTQLFNKKYGPKNYRPPTKEELRNARRSNFFIYKD